MFKLKIESNGTTEGTSITVNGEVIDNVVCCSFSCNCGTDRPYFSYTTEDIKDEGAGLITMETNYLVDPNQVSDMVDQGHKYVGQANIDGKRYELFKISKVICVCECGKLVGGLTHNSNVAKNEPSWGSVDKTKLPMVAFADHGDGKNHSTFAYPHHWVSNGTLYLHRGGLASARAAAQGARSGKKAKPSVIAHLAKHAKDIGMGNEKK
jgi:hypothetical protein